MAIVDPFIEQQLVVNVASLPQLDEKEVSRSSFLPNRTDSIQEN